MKQIVLLLLVCSMFLALQGITITSPDYGYQAGKTRIFKQGSWNSSGTDLTEGSGKNWSFSLPTTGYVNNSYSAVSNVPGFGTANICASYTQQINGYDSAGMIYYQDNGTDILQIGYTGAPNIIWNPAIPSGLPHYLGKTWQGSHSYPYGTYTISGKVISEGNLSTHLGTYPAVCVRYSYSSSVISYTVYQWESVQYGIMAYTLTLNGGMLYVLYQAEPSVANAEFVQYTQTPSMQICPNPTRKSMQLRFENPGSNFARLQVFNLRGQLLQTELYSGLGRGEQSLDLELDRTVLPAGIYLLRLELESCILTRRLIISPL